MGVDKKVQQIEKFLNNFNMQALKYIKEEQWPEDYT